MKDKLEKAESGIARLENEIGDMESSLVHVQNEATRLEENLLTRLEFQMMFRTDDDRLSEFDRERVTMLVESLNRNPDLKVRLDGHADQRGAEEYNNRLAEYRAQSVADALIERGISEQRIEARSQGSFQASSTNGDYEGDAQKCLIKNNWVRMPGEFIKRTSGEIPVNQLVRLIVNCIDRLTDWLGTLLSWMCFAMMLLACTVVAMRYLFHSGNIIFLQEAVIYLHSTIFLLAIGWALKRNGHVRVDVFYRQFSPTKKAWIDSLGVLVFLLPFCVFLFFASLDFVELSWSRKETSGDAGGIPFVYLLKTLIPTMSVVLALQGIVELIKNGLFLCGLTDAPTSEKPNNSGLEL